MRRWCVGWLGRGLKHTVPADLVVRDMLSPEQVAVLNAAVDAHEHEVEWEDNHQYGGGMRGLDPDGKHMGGTKGSCLEWEQPHCQPFRDLIANPKTVPYLDTCAHACRALSARPQSD